MTAVRPMAFTTGDTPLPDIIILTHNLTRDYDMGGEIVHALRGIDVQIKRNEFVASVASTPPPPASTGSTARRSAT